MAVETHEDVGENVLTGLGMLFEVDCTVRVSVEFAQQERISQNQLGHTEKRDIRWI